MIEPGEFKRVGDRIVYVRSRDGDGGLERVLISDRTDPERPFMIFAESGSFGWDGERGEARFRLRNGDIHLEPADPGGAQYQRIGFQNFVYSFPVKNLLELETARLRPKDLTTAELRARLAALEDAARPAVGPRSPGVPRADPPALRAADGADAFCADRGAARHAPHAGRALVGHAAVRRGGRDLLRRSNLQSVSRARGRDPGGDRALVPNALCAVAAAVLLARARRPAG